MAADRDEDRSVVQPGMFQMKYPTRFDTSYKGLSLECPVQGIRFLRIGT